jgi:hypothetical protein
MYLSESTKYRKCGKQKESSHHKFCKCPSMARHKLEIFSSVWLEPIDIRRASVILVMALRYGQHSSKGPKKLRDAQWTQQWSQYLR